MMAEAKVKFDRDRANQYDFDILFDNCTRTKTELNFDSSIDKSVYFLLEARIIELSNMAGFSRVSKFYNAFLSGGWTAKYIRY